MNIIKILLKYFKNITEYLFYIFFFVKRSKKGKIPTWLPCYLVTFTYYRLSVIGYRLSVIRPIPARDLLGGLVYDVWFDVYSVCLHAMCVKIF
jgi:hypothetical protein